MIDEPIGTYLSEVGTNQRNLLREQYAYDGLVCAIMDQWRPIRTCVSWTSERWLRVTVSPLTVWLTFQLVMVSRLSKSSRFFVKHFDVKSDRPNTGVFRQILLQCLYKRCRVFPGEWLKTTWWVDFPTWIIFYQ